MSRVRRLVLDHCPEEAPRARLRQGLVASVAIERFPEGSALVQEYLRRKFADAGITKATTTQSGPDKPVVFHLSDGKCDLEVSFTPSMETHSFIEQIDDMIRTRWIPHRDAFYRGGI